MTKESPSVEWNDAELTFEEALKGLEAMVERLEEGGLGLSEALAEYEKGIKLVRHCHQLLERAERRIELLTGVTEGGAPITEPFCDEEHSSLDEKGYARGKRRTAPGRGRAAPENAGTLPEEPRVDSDRPLF
jgi:exodeoxyribonuclease VII small subunit